MAEQTARTDRAEQASTAARIEAEAAAKDAEAARIGQAEAEADAAELRQRERAWWGQGRWARLKAAWRGE
jgi:hypothetical protein